MAENFGDHCMLGLTHVAQQSLREKLRLLPHAPTELLPLQDPNARLTTTATTTTTAASSSLCDVPPSLYAPVFLDFPSSDASNVPPADWLMNYSGNLYPLDVPSQFLHHTFPSTDVPSSYTSRDGATQGLTLSLASSLPPDPPPLGLLPSPATHCAIGPLGPFTGYATILQGSKYLKPAQQLLDECCIPVTSSVHPKPPHLSSFAINLPSAADSKHFTSIASSSRCSLLDTTSTLHRTEIQERKAKLLLLQGEVCRRYKQYTQQVQMATSSFESVAGLSGAIPFMSAAAKTVSRHFRFLKHVISEQVLQMSRLLGEDTAAGSPPPPPPPTNTNTSLNSCSRSKFLEQTLRRQKAEGGVLENSQPIWRPQRGLPDRAVAVLRAWLFDHFLHPYPTDTDKLMLAQQTGLSRNQVSNWFINARVRVWKPMVEEIHMLETKGSTERDISCSRNDTSQTSICNQDRELQQDRQSGNFSHLSEVDPPFESHCQPLVEQWPIAKQPRLDVSSSVTNPTGQFAQLPSYHHGGGIQMGGLGQVSLTLGLRQDEGAWQQQYQPMRPYFGSPMIND